MTGMLRPVYLGIVASARPCFVIKAANPAPTDPCLRLDAHRTMYGGKTIAPGDRVFLFTSRRDGPAGLMARGVVTASVPVPRGPAARETPRVTVEVTVEAANTRPLGRVELGRHRSADGSPGHELFFEFYRQATDKVGGVTAAATVLLDGCFDG